MKKQLKVEITELFMAKADWKRCFHGTIKREKDENGNLVLSSKIYVKTDKFNEVIFAKVCDPTKKPRDLQDQLGEQLDSIVKLILDCDLTKLKPITENVGELSYCIN
jgi:hypothetical protein